MKFLTLNFWWNPLYQKARLEAVQAEVRRHRPDVVAFQETGSDLSELMDELFPEYFRYPRRPSVAGTMLLTREDVWEHGRLELTSTQGRELVWCRQESMLAATVHLESRRTQREARMEQLGEIFTFLERYRRVVLLGDFNFSPDWPENRIVPLGYLDAWSELRPKEPGFTEDTSVNLMRLRASGKEKHVRFDRVFCRGLRPLRIDLVCTEPVESLPDIWPSDHFGLACELATSTDIPGGDRRMLLGRWCREYGLVKRQRLDRAHAALTTGSDPNSPSLRAKGDRMFPNEDALLVIRDGERYLTAVADGHFGAETSHALIERLRDRKLPGSLEELLDTVHGLQTPPLEAEGGSTLLVSLTDTGTGRGFGVCTGDATLAVLNDGFHTTSPHNSRYVYFNRPLERHEWETFDYSAPPGSLVLLHTDGLNECHYRHPETSVTPEHIVTLWAHTAGEVERFTELLAKLALEGLGGYPGGQDNLALIVLEI